MRTHQPGLERPFSDEVLASTMAAVKPSPHQRLQKILLVAAVATFVFALLWLIAPWVSSRLHSSNPAREAAKQPQGAISQTTALPTGTSNPAAVQKLAEQGDPAAQFSLGARYATG